MDYRDYAPHQLAGALLLLLVQEFPPVPAQMEAQRLCEMIIAATEPPESPMKPMLVARGEK